MKYLLSTGKTTEDRITYIKDIILINMKLLKQEIPYFDGGSDELIPDVRTDELKSHIEIIVNDILVRVRNSFKNIKLDLSEVKISNQMVTVIINIENSTETYDIKRTNQS